MRVYLVLSIGKYMRLVIILLFLATNLSAQNIFRVVGKSKNLINISRTTVVSKDIQSVAEAVLKDRSAEIIMQAVKKEIVLQSVIEQPFCLPEEVPGGYNYLRTVSKEMRCEGVWKKVVDSDSYNGAHHIINKSVLEVIYKDLEIRARQAGNMIDFTFDEFQSNAPAVFHPFHNSSKYKHIFHNRERQLRLYYSEGVFGCMEDYFKQINQVNALEGLQLYDREFMRTTLLESSLWAQHYGLFWKM